MYINLCPIIVERFIHSSICTISRISFDAMTFYGLEPSNFIVPEGEYLLTLTNSPRFSSKYPYNKLFDSKVPLVNGVINHSGVRIHVGNYPSDTDGCLLIGLRHNGSSVLDSVKAYKQMLSRMTYLYNINSSVFYVIKYINCYE